MKHLLLNLALLAHATSIASFSATPTLMGDNTNKEIIHYLRKMADFDYKFPREKILLFFDRPAYLIGDTIWFKALVTRAASHRPQPLSRIIYVELLNDNGQILERSSLPIDSPGGAQRYFDLHLPVREGFHEIRVYTHAMMNWDANAIFSKVVPVFSYTEMADGQSVLNIHRPEQEGDLMPGHERPYDFSKKEHDKLTFYPESGRRMARMQQRMAFFLRNEREEAVTDTVKIFDENEKFRSKALPDHQRIGWIELPADMQGSYAMVGNQRFDLPAENTYGAALTGVHHDAQWDVALQMPQSQDIKIGVVIIHHERPIWFNLFPLNNETTTLTILDSCLRNGVKPP